MKIDLIRDLKDTKWKTKIDAVSKVRSLKTSRDIQDFFNLSLDLKDEIIYGYFVSFSEDYLKYNDEKTTSVVILSLLKISSISKVNKKSALTIIKNYFANPKAVRYIKILTLQHCFLKSKGEGRLLLTKIIGNNKFIELAPQVLRNFRLQDEEIIHISMLVFVNFRDKRANSYIRKYISTSNSLLRRASIEALGHIGGILDIYPIFVQLRKRDGLAVTCFRSLIKIIGWPSVFLTRYILKRFPASITSTMDFYRTVSDFPYRLNLNLLIRQFLEEKEQKNIFIIEMYLREANQKYVLKKMTTYYEDLDDFVKIRVLQYMAESIDERVVPFLKDEFRKNPDIAHRTLILEILCEFKDAEEFDFLIENFKSEKTSMSYFYIHYLMTYPSHLLSPHLEEILKFVEDEKTVLFYEVILSALKVRADELATLPSVTNFIERSLSHPNDRVIYLTLKAVGKTGNVHYVEKVNGYVLDEKQSKTIRSQAALTLWKILQNNPDLVEKYNHLLVNPYVKKALRVDKIKSPFFLAILDSIRLNEEDGCYSFMKNNFYIAYERPALLRAVASIDYGLEKLLHFSIKFKAMLNDEQWEIVDHIVSYSSDYNLLASYYRLKGINKSKLSIDDFSTINQLQKWGYGTTGIFRPFIRGSV